MILAVSITSWIWLVLEASLIIRDRLRGKGSTARDGGTRLGVIVTIVPATLVGYGLMLLLGPVGEMASPSTGVLAAGLALMWVGLVVRVWAIVSLGRAFRTTVEVDDDQVVVTGGPYRWVRHPSYTGILVISLGYGLALDNWISLAIVALVPVWALLRRIRVEEDAMVETLGRRYEDYRTHTARLVPGVW